MSQHFHPWRAMRVWWHRLRRRPLPASLTGPSAPHDGRRAVRTIPAHVPTAQQLAVQRWQGLIQRRLDLLAAERDLLRGAR